MVLIMHYLKQRSNVSIRPFHRHSEDIRGQHLKALMWCKLTYASSPFAQASAASGCGAT